MTIHEIMSRDVLSITPTAPVLEALRMMSSSGVRHLPVLENGRLVGILSDRDVNRFESSEEISNDVVIRHLNAPVAESMTREPQTIASTAGLDEAAQIMIDSKVGALPVVDDGAVVGMVSTIDVLAWARSEGKLS